MNVQPVGTPAQPRDPRVTEPLSSLIARAGDPVHDLETLLVQDSASQIRTGRRIRELHRLERRRKLQRAIGKMKEAAGWRVFSAGACAVVSVAASAFGAAASSAGTAAQASTQATAAATTQAAISASTSATGSAAAGIGVGVVTQSALNGTQAATRHLILQMLTRALDAAFSKFNPMDHAANQADARSQVLRLDSDEAGEKAQEAGGWLARARETESKMLDRLSSMHQSDHALTMSLLR
jgi:hypothetical protein